jgi:hypothetical protein
MAIPELRPPHHRQSRPPFPIQLDGHSDRILLQLDTGTSSSQFDARLYGQIFGKGIAPEDFPQKCPMSGTFAGARVDRYPITVVPRRGGLAAPGEPILLGTLGADFLQTRILVLDFLHQRLAILNEGATLPATFESAANFVPLSVSGGKLYVQLTINGRPEIDFFYDSGSSAFPLTTTRAKWQALTGRTGNEPTDEVWRVNSWGREAVMVGAPIPGDLLLGAARLEHPSSFSNPPASAISPMSTSSATPFFLDRFIVIVDCPHRRFGLIKPTPSGR